MLWYTTALWKLTLTMAASDRACCQDIPLSLNLSLYQTPQPIMHMQAASYIMMVYRRLTSCESLPRAMAAAVGENTLSSSAVLRPLR